MSAEVYITTEHGSEPKYFTVLCKEGRALQSVMTTASMFCGSVAPTESDIDRITVNDDKVTDIRLSIVQGDIVRYSCAAPAEEKEEEPSTIVTTVTIPEEDSIAIEESKSTDVQESISVIKANITKAVEILKGLKPHVTCLENDLKELTKFKNDISVEIEKTDSFLAAMQEHVSQFETVLNTIVADVSNMEHSN